METVLILISQFIEGNKKQKKKAEKFLQKDHTDSNMLVAIRIRPLNQREITVQDKDIIRAEDKLLVRNFK